MDQPNPLLPDTLGSGLTLGLEQTLWRALSDLDKESYASLKHAFNRAWEFASGDGRYEDVIAGIFASPLYSDDCKRYFAVANVSSSHVLRLQGGLLTEELIFSHVNAPKGSYLGGAYLTALMGSKHLSERIIEAVFIRADKRVSRAALEQTPNTMVTPRVVKGWLLQASRKDSFYFPEEEEEEEFGARHIRRAHPEYEGLPDEWVLKVFCGG